LLPGQLQFSRERIQQGPAGSLALAGEKLDAALACAAGVECGGGRALAGGSNESAHVEVGVAADVGLILADTDQRGRVPAVAAEQFVEQQRLGRELVAVGVGCGIEHQHGLAVALAALQIRLGGLDGCLHALAVLLADVAGQSDTGLLGEQQVDDEFTLVLVASS
jgi:hypothetical protein